MAFMFLGMGISYILNETAAGLLIGMGVSLLAMAYLRRSEIAGAGEGRGWAESLGSRAWGRAVLAVIGLGFVALGASLLLSIRIPWDKAGGILFILMGLAFLAGALEGRGGRRVSREEKRRERMEGS